MCFFTYNVLFYRFIDEGAKFYKLPFPWLWRSLGATQLRSGFHQYDPKTYASQLMSSSLLLTPMLTSFPSSLSHHRQRHWNYARVHFSVILSNFVLETEIMFSYSTKNINKKCSEHGRQTSLGFRKLWRTEQPPDRHTKTTNGHTWSVDFIYNMVR